MKFQKNLLKTFMTFQFLGKTSKLLTRMNLLSPGNLEKWSALVGTMATLIEQMRADDVFMDDAPDEFLDPILCDVMTDPVRLPSGHIMDRNSIKQHLLNDELNPFTREKLTVDDLVPATELKARIEAWIKEQRNKALNAVQTAQDTSSQDVKDCKGST